MNDPFTVKARFVFNDLENINEHRIQEIEQLGFNLMVDVENTIKLNPETGERQLKAVFNEILEEYQHMETMVNIQIRKLEKKGFSDYDSSLGRLKEFLYQVEGVLGRLLQLGLNYFPELAIKHKDVYKKFHPALFKRIEAIQKQSGPLGQKAGRPDSVYKFEKVVKNGYLTAVDEAISQFREKTATLEENPGNAISDICKYLYEKNVFLDGYTFRGIVRAMAEHLGKSVEFTNDQYRKDKYFSSYGVFHTCFKDHIGKSK